jgi:hypothetical protein
VVAGWTRIRLAPAAMAVDQPSAKVARPFLNGTP